MRKSFVVACLSSAVIACSGSDSAPPALTLTPSGTQNVTGPTLIAASEADVNWTVSGGGTLSGATGQQVVYQPPAGNTTATVTASAGNRTASVTLNVAAPSAGIPGGQIAALSAAVQVEYDAEGIPHIFCQTVADCFTVQGFLQAQDRLFEMDLFRRTAEGRLSELLGPIQVKSDQQFITLFTTRDGSDVTAKMAAAIDPASKAKLDAYVSGVNAYLQFLQAHPQLMPGEYAQISAGLTPADIDAWTEKDSFAIGRLQQFQLSESIEEETAYGLLGAVYGSSSPGRFGAYVHAQQPIRDYTLSPTDPPAAAIAPKPPSGQLDLGPWQQNLAQVNAQMHEMHEMFGVRRLGAGSNNWVVDGAHSANGKALVANDPHLQLFYPSLFHLSAMTSADGAMDIAGGSFPGVPGALVGRGQHLGWGVTVVGYDVTDLYLEQVDPTCGTGTPTPVPCVIFNGAPVPMTVRSVPMKVRNGTGKESTTVLIVPHHGPVISFNPANPTTAISMRWTGHEATNDFLGFFGLTTATAVGTTTDPATATTAFGALRNYGVGAQNFVLADDQGHIGYDPHALVPKRGTWPSNTTPGHMPWLPVTGDGTAEWGDGVHDCAAATPDPACWVDDAQLPQAVDPAKGYLATANSDPVGTTDDNDPIANAGVPGTPPYLSFDWDDPTTVRYARIASLLSAKTANGGKLTLKDMQDIQSDHTIQLADLFLSSTQFAAAVPATGTGSSTVALQMLQAWKPRHYDCPTALTGLSPNSAPSTDATVLANSAACLLFHQFLRTVLTNVFNDDFSFVAKATGQNPGGDSGRQLRALLFMLNLPPNATGTEFCNDVNPSTGATLQPTTCAQQVNTALTSAFNTIVAELGPPPAAGATSTKWLWGKFHTLTTTSPAAPLIASGFSGGPFARPGGALSVDVGNPDASQSTPLGFTYSHGSNVRFIGEIEAPATSTILMQLPGVEHDAPFGTAVGSADLLTPYAANQYFTYLMNHEVDAATVSTQGFSK